MRLAAPALAVALAAALSPRPARAGSRLAPIPKDEAVVVHGPYEAGACDTCHARNDPRDPGPAAVTNETCLGCHDEFNGKAPVRIERGTHTTRGTCTGCHNPHNSRKRKLLQ